MKKLINPLLALAVLALLAAPSSAGSSGGAAPAATATALAANGANCATGSAAGGVDASGASEGCVVLPLYSFLAADVSNGTTMAATGLSVTVLAGHKYGFRAVLMITSDDGGDGYKVDFDGGTATATAIRMHAFAFDDAALLLTPSPASATALATDISCAGFSSTGQTLLEVSGGITVNAGGTFAIRFAPNTVSTATVFRGSHLAVWDMP